MSIESSQPSYDSSSPELIDISYLWQRRWFLFSCTMLITALGAVYVLFVTPSYRIGARVLIEQQGGPLDQLTANERDRSFLATQAEIMRSPKILKGIVTELEILPDRTRDLATVNVIQRLTADPLIGTNVLSIRFYDKDPKLGIAVVQKILDKYTAYVKEIERESHGKTLELLIKREAKIQSEIDAKREEQRALRKQSELVGYSSDAVDVQKALLTTLGNAITETTNRRTELENHLRILVRSESPFVDELVSIREPSVGQQDDQQTTAIDESDSVLGNRTLDVLTGLVANGWIGIENPAPMIKLHAVAESNLVAVVSKYGFKHPNVIAARKQVSALEARLQRMVDAAPAELERHLYSLRQQEKDLTDRFQTNYAKVKKLDEYVLQEMQLQEQLASLSNVHDTAMGQWKQHQLVNDASTDGRMQLFLKVLEEPAVGPLPLTASKWLVLGISAIVGLLGGIFLVTVQRQLNSLQR